MKSITQYVATLTLVGLLTASNAHGRDLEGVSLPDSYQVSDVSLALNGMGVREKLIFKIYVAGLYLPQIMDNADNIIRSDTAKVLVMQFMRDIPRAKLVQAYTEAFAANAPELAARQKTDVDKFFAFLDDVKNGDRLSFVYQPGKGSTFARNNANKLIVAGKEFADLYLQVYIGPQPPTPALKRGLLGLK